MDIEITPLHSWQIAALKSPYTHTCLYGGIATGKSCTLSHFVIDHMLTYPKYTGLIGASNYDQLSSATLRELLYWLDHYGFDYVIDCRPPTSWDLKRQFKKYSNILSIRHPNNKDVSTWFTRVLSDGNAIRGIEISFFCLDEIRDCPEETYDILLSRVRESEYMKSLVVSTTAGHDWSFKRFVEKADRKLYGSIHIKTIEAVHAGIITQKFYDSLLASYSPLMADQELMALHVNITGGRAYYAASEQNKMRQAPWGDSVPQPDRPLIVYCDFNFSPAPLVWGVAQRSPAWWEEDRIHCFGELSGVEISTVEMTQRLMMQYPGFFYQIFGDASGTRGSTSNAGMTDFNQIGATLAENDHLYSIDVDPSNPLVKDRVENLCRLLCNALGQIRITYNADACPLLDGDFKSVGWRQRSGTNQAKGKLDDGGDSQRTHASDGLGYACYKLFPPGRVFEIGESIKSSVREEAGLVYD